VIPTLAIALIVSFLTPDQKEIKRLAQLLSIQVALKSDSSVMVEKHAIGVHSGVRPCLLTARRGTLLPV